jgi:carbon-monoxide dehydrogenase large subunit
MRAGPGDRVGRLEDTALLRGDARYVADLRPAGGALHAVFVRAAVASARIDQIDVSGARGRPGVVCVARAGEHGLPLDGPLPGMVPGLRRPLLADTVVRHVGEPVAVVVATTLAHAVDAAEHVVVAVTPRPVVASVEAALAPGAPLVHPTMASNVYLTGRFPNEGAATAGGGPAEGAGTGTRDVLAGAATIVRTRTTSQRVAAAPMEPNGVLAVPDEPTGGVTLWASTQFVHGVRREVAELLGLPQELVRVVTPRVGGGFGPKFETAPEYVAVVALARTLGRPVRWQETRSENLVTMPHGRGHHQEAELGLDADGRFTGLRVRVRTDAGAYPMAGAGSPVGTGVLMVPGPYLVDALDIEVSTVATHTPPVGVYRGPGRAEPNYLRERLVDAAARASGIDPIELRRRNLVPADRLPYRSPTGFVYDTGDYRAVLDLAVARAGVAGRRAEQAARRAAGDPVELGIGVACWLDVTPRNRVGEYASVRVLPAPGGDLRVEVRAGTCDHGQGHETSWALVLSGILGVPLESVRLVPADTAEVPRGDGTGSARSLQLVASTLTVAGHEVLVQATALAAHLLEAAPHDIVPADGGLAVAGTPGRRVSWHDLAAAASSPSLPPEVAALVPGGVLGAAADEDQLGPTFPFGVHVAVVEVDTATGGVTPIAFVAVDDCGTVVNPVVVEGQQHGGIAQGIGQALFEHGAFADDGTPLAGTFLDYLVPAASELPPFDVGTTGGPTPRNVVGAKGIGQGGAIGAPAAIVNAVLDALAPHGVLDVDMPLAPARVHAAIVAARG